uniref:F-box domain-containing protein n=1 Tax=Leersia perrieri TaxID=77586 RepID=A0A0D9WLU7_9ORYZ
MQPVPPPLPWLTLLDGTFLNISSGVIHRVPMPDDACCHGSLDNWLVLLKSDGGCYLMNPFSKDKLKLPRLATYNGAFPSKPLFYKLVVPSHLDSSPDSLVAVLITNDADFSTIFICQPPVVTDSSKGKKPLKNLTDIAFFNGNLYAIAKSRNLLLLEISGSSGKKPSISAIDSVINSMDHLSDLPQPLLNLLSVRREYLVECSGRLFTVTRYLNLARVGAAGQYYYRTATFEVFEADLSNIPGRWRRVYNLGGQALFVGKHCSKAFPAGEASGAQEDCIYFMTEKSLPKFLADRLGDSDPLRDSGVYNMRNGMVTPLTGTEAALPHHVGQATQSSSWEDLLPELLGLLLKRLPSLADRFVANGDPMLSCSPSRCRLATPMDWTFLSISDDEIHRIPLPDDASCHGSVDNWLFLKDSDVGMMIGEMLTMDCPYPWTDHQIAPSQRIDTDSFRFHDGPFKNCFCDITFCGGKLYALSCGKLYTIEMSEDHKGNPNVPCIECIVKDFPTRLLSQPCPENYVYVQWPYLVESDGRLLNVIRYIGFPSTLRYPSRNPHTLSFEVFEADLGTSSRMWRRMKSLEGQALFVGTHCSKSLHAAECVGAQDDCIYFMCDYSQTTADPLHDAGVYNMRNGTIMLLLQDAAAPRLHRPTTQPSPWADLQTDLLVLLLDRLPSLVDRVRLRAVCRPWRFDCNDKLQTLNPPLPWLSLPNGTFLSILDGEIHRLPLPKNTSCHGSIDSWLFLRDSDGRFSLMNPFSKATLQLPKLANIWHYENRNVCNDRTPLFYKLVVPSPLNLSPDPLLVVLINEGDQEQSTACICNPPIATDSFKFLDRTFQTTNQIFDIAFYDGKFYALHASGKLSILEINEGFGGKPKVSSIEIIVDESAVGSYFHPFPESRLWPYLVESGGRLLQVVRYLRIPIYMPIDDIAENSRTISFEVYEADLSTGSGMWRRVTSFGDQALFVGTHGSKSVPAKEYGGIQEDSIYFMCDYYLPYGADDPLVDSGIYNMKNGMITPLLQGINSQWQPPRGKGPTQSSSWADLQPDLLGLVLRRLPSLADRVRLRAVCRPWRSNAQLQSLPSPLPWLSLLNGTFLSISDGEIHGMALPDDADCYGSIDNWLFLRDDDDGCSLMNPFSKTTLQLPNLASIWHDERENGCNVCTRLFYKFTVPLPLDLSPNSLVAVLINNSFYDRTVCIFHRSTATDSFRSCYHPFDANFYDIAFCGGKLYALRGERLFTLDISQGHKGKPKAPHIECVVEAVPTRSLTKPCPENCICVASTYLVESGGRLLKVVRFVVIAFPPLNDDTFKDSRTFSFEVYEADFSAGSCMWRRVNSLGGRSIFLGRHCSKSLSAAECVKAQDDCIYFMCDSYLRPNADPLCDAGIYNMSNGGDHAIVAGDHSVTPASYRRGASDMWFFPSDAVQFSSWADLRPELLGLILKCLPSLADRVRLSAVCRPWRSHAQLQPLPPPLPWLTLLNGTFLNISDGEIYNMPLPDDASCHGSIDNWLFLKHGNGGFSLMNPFSKATLQLPKLDIIWCHHQWYANSKYPLFYKLAVPFPLDSSPHSLVVALIMNLGSALSLDSVTKSQSFPEEEGYLIMLRYYLVESGGDLLMVTRYIGIVLPLAEPNSFKHSRTLSFEVFEADLTTGSRMWRRAKHSLLAHIAPSLPAAECGQPQEDCIYFMCDYWRPDAGDPLNDSGVYNMRNGMITPFLQDATAPRLHPTGQAHPAWFFPAAVAM